MATSKMGRGGEGPFFANPIQFLDRILRRLLIFTEWVLRSLFTHQAKAVYGNRQTNLFSIFHNYVCAQQYEQKINITGGAAQSIQPNGGYIKKS